MLKENALIGFAWQLLIFCCLFSIPKATAFGASIPLP